ncbi:MAG: hypothetical protein V4591_07770 [Bdellovibrionota bacterium]
MNISATPRSSTYKKIALTLCSGALEFKDICKIMKVEPTGFMSKCLDDLIKSGFITRNYSWNFISGEVLRTIFFRLSDNYIRFYLKYIDKNRIKIDNNDTIYKSLSLLPNWETILGFQFENLVLKNRMLIKNALRIKPDEVISDNPYTQKKTNKIPGCQIDYLIQTKFGTLYVCEIKFKKNQIGGEIIAEVKKKIDNLHLPKGFSCRPVLIHVNGVHEDVADSGFFSDIIDFSKFLEQ